MQLFSAEISVNKTLVQHKLFIHYWERCRVMAELNEKTKPAEILRKMWLCGERGLPCCWQETRLWFAFLDSMHTMMQAQVWVLNILLLNVIVGGYTDLKRVHMNTESFLKLTTHLKSCLFSENHCCKHTQQHYNGTKGDDFTFKAILC